MPFDLHRNLIDAGVRRDEKRLHVLPAKRRIRGLLGQPNNAQQLPGRNDLQADHRGDVEIALAVHCHTVAAALAPIFGLPELAQHMSVRSLPGDSTG